MVNDNDIVSSILSARRKPKLRQVLPEPADKTPESKCEHIAAVIILRNPNLSTDYNGSLCNEGKAIDCSPIALSRLCKSPVVITGIEAGYIYDRLCQLVPRKTMDYIEVAPGLVWDSKKARLMSSDSFPKYMV